MADTHAPILLYDGTCGFCAGSVQFMLARDRRCTLRFGPLEGRAGRALLARHPALAGGDSVVWLDGTRALVRGDAALAALAYVGGSWGVLAAMGRWLPRRWRDAVYDAVARRRFALAARACFLPSPEERARFLP